jgi:CubicO group peptidase (beta-lactamase class C family)
MFHHSPASPLLTADGLAGTSRDLAQWLAFHLNRGRTAEVQLMSERAIEDMQTIQFLDLRGPRYHPQSAVGSDGAGWGLGWLVWPCESHQCIGHFSSVRGYTAIVAGDRDLKTGVAVLTNSHAAQGTLIELAKNLLKIAASESVFQRA